LIPATVNAVVIPLALAIGTLGNLALRCAMLAAVALLYAAPLCALERNLTRLPEHHA